MKTKTQSVRMTRWQKSRIERAAELTGMSVSEFVRQAVTDRACEVLSAKWA